MLVRDFEYELKVTPLETELFDLTLEQIAVADVVVECAQREPFAVMCSFFEHILCCLDRLLHFL